MVTTHLIIPQTRRGQMTKVLILSTSLKGGGGQAALNLKLSLKSRGYETVLLSRENITEFSNDPSWHIFLRRVQSGIVTRLQQWIVTKKYGFISTYSVNFIPFDLIKKIKPDIVHIHNWYNLLDLKTLEKVLANYKVILSTHDVRLLTGGCHVLLGCEEFKNGCQQCPAVRIGKNQVKAAKARTSRIFANAKDLSLVSPSEWLQELLSNNIHNHQNISISKIPNIINSNYRVKTEYRTRSDISKLLFVSSDLSASFKGGRILIEGLNKLSNLKPNMNFSLTLAGEGRIKELESAKFPFAVITPRTTQELSELYENSDLLIIPSLSENFPTVAIEAQIQGLPILGTEVGGIPEIIRDGETGFLCEATSDGIAYALASLTIENLNNAGRTALKEASNLFNNSHTIDQYVKLLK